MKKRISMLIAVMLLLGITGNAHALLFSRLGGAAVYDDDLDITWLSDANLGAGSAFDDGSSPTDGRMTWQNAKDWAASLTVGGFTDWRLPTTLQPDSSCIGQGPFGSGVASSWGFNCRDSEMGHLFYDELGGTASSSILSSSDPDLAFFSNIQADWYWSGTELGPGSDGKWIFNFSDGEQFVAGHGGNRFVTGMGASLNAWALRSGDVAPAAVPEPGTLFLLGTGLFGLALYRKRLNG